MKVLMSFLFLAAVQLEALADCPAPADAGQNGSVTIAGKVVNYQSNIGFIEVQSKDLSTQACLFYVAYTVPSAQGANRPLTFAFNGGPGSAAMWLHMGFLGPKRVDLGPDGNTPSNPASIVDNAYSPLDVTDIVLIDPVGSGLSYTENEKPKDPFYGVMNDVTSFANFIQSYLIQFNRNSSPIFLLGESYGGFRAAILADTLQSVSLIPVAGVILISPYLSANQTFYIQGEADVTAAPDNLLPYWTFFPSFATTAQFHQVSATRFQSVPLDQLYLQAQSFAQNVLLPALNMGVGISNETLNSVAAQYAEYTGLDPSDIAQNLLRITDVDFFSVALKKLNLVTGADDGRETGPVLPTYEDPTGAVSFLTVTPLFNQYLHNQLGYTGHQPYQDFARPQSWPSDNIVDVGPSLLDAMLTNPHLRVFVSSGYYDLNCPMAGVDYELNQFGTQQTAARVTQGRYIGGHTTYTDVSALAQMKSDIAKFIIGSK